MLLFDANIDKDLKPCSVNGTNGSTLDNKQCARSEFRGKYVFLWVPLRK